MLVSQRRFRWNEWGMSLVGLFDLSWLELEWMLCDFFPFSHFINLKNQRILDLTLFSQFLLFLDSLLSSFFASKYLVLWESKYPFNCFDYTCEIIELFQVLTYSYTWKIDVVHHSPMPCHERAPDTDLETAHYRMVSL